MAGSGLLATSGLVGLGCFTASVGGVVGVLCQGAASTSDGSNTCLSLGSGSSALAGSNNGAETVTQIQSAVIAGVGNVVTFATKTVTITNSSLPGSITALDNTAVATGAGATATSGSNNGGGSISQVQLTIVTGNGNTIHFAPQTATGTSTFTGTAIAIGNSAVANGAGAVASAGSDNTSASIAQIQSTPVTGSGNVVNFAPQTATVANTFNGVVTAIGNSAVANGAGAVASAGSDNLLGFDVTAIGNVAVANGPGSVAIAGSGNASPVGVVVAIGNIATATGRGAVAIAGSFGSGGVDNTATAKAGPGGSALASAGSG